MIIIVYGVVWNRYSDTSRDIIKEIKILQNGGKTMDNKMGRKLNMEELEQIAGGTDPKEYVDSPWNHTPSCIPEFATFVKHQIMIDESARIRAELENGKDFKIF